MDNMETQLYHQEPFSHHEMVNEDQSFLEKKKSLSDYATVPADNCCRSFDCNICLDNARDPVVTLCGHLYCWPCIFKWLRTQGTSTTLELHGQPQQRCPVCKADVSDTTLVPLYGRGDFSPQTETKDSSDLEIPRRPPAYGLNALIAASPNQQLHSGPSNLQSQFESDQNQQYYAPSFSAASPMLSRGGTTIHPMIWMFGEMVHARVFGNSTEVNLIGYPNSYHHLTDSSPRVRRREMKTEKSLNRVSIFLFCCILFCLLVF